MKKLVITGNGAGWGSNFLKICDQLNWCMDNDTEPYILLGPETECFFNGSNVWDRFYIQEHATELFSTEHKAVIESDFRKPICLSLENRLKGERVYNKYIKPTLKPEVLEKITKFMSSNSLLNNEYDSLHFRGTDWCEHIVGKRRAVIYPLSRYLDEVEKVYDPNKKLFVMSDNIETINSLKNKFKNVIYYSDILRSDSYDGLSVHHDLYNKNPKLVEDLIIETTICSLADSFIHSEGNIDLMILIMNSNLKSKYIKTL